MPSANRKGGRRWTKLVQLVIMEENGICWLCGIGGATTGDHVIPIKYRPDLEFDRENVHAAHASCNFSRGARPVTGRKTMRTSRQW